MDNLVSYILIETSSFPSVLAWSFCSFLLSPFLAFQVTHSFFPVLNQSEALRSIFVLLTAL